MRWFVILTVLTGAYYFMLMESANMAIDQTKQLQQQYTTIADQAAQLASGEANR